jgi:hypothetical protein
MTGKPAFQYVHGQTLFEYLNEHPDAGGIFNQAMTAYSEQEIAAILGAYDFSCVSRDVDVGGGHGRLIAAILGANAQARGILFDQAPVVEGARDFIAQAGLETRCELVAGDFFHSVPAGGDLYNSEEYHPRLGRRDSRSHSQKLPCSNEKPSTPRIGRASGAARE